MVSKDSKTSDPALGLNSVTAISDSLRQTGKMHSAAVGEQVQYPLLFGQDNYVPPRTGEHEHVRASQLPTKGCAPLGAVLCTERLQSRLGRSPDLQGENAALCVLAEALADSPDTILQTLADTVLSVLNVGSAGVSLLTEDKLEFSWAVVAGAWHAHAGKRTPRSFSPCGDVLDRNVPLLFERPERRYAYFSASTPLAKECLHVPVRIHGKAVGTVWAITHDDSRQFDLEDLRQLESLARFAAASCQATAFLNRKVEQERTLRVKEAALAQMEELIGHRTAQLETLLNRAPLGVYLVDADFRICEANPIALQVFGAQPNVIGRDFDEVIHVLWPGVYADEIVQRFRHTLASGDSFVAPERTEHRIDLNAVESFEWRIDRVPMLDGRNGVVCYFRDISERVETQRQLVENEHLYHQLFNLLDAGYCIIEMIFDDAGKPVDYLFLEVNAAFEKQSGIRDAPGKRMLEIAPNHERYWFETYGQVVRTGEPIHFINTAQALNDNWFELYAFQLGGRASRKVAVVFYNITERKNDEQALRESEERYRASEERSRALFDSGPIAMYSCDAGGVIQAFNRGAAALYGREPATGDTCEKFLSAFKVGEPSKEGLAYSRTPMAQVLTGELADVRDMEIEIVRPDGSQLTAIANIVPLQDGNGKITGTINCFFDITERSRLEKIALEQAESLSELHRRKDEFLAMLSHELRNPLAPLSNAVQLLNLRKDDDPVRQQARDIITRQVGNLKLLVDDLLEVSRLTTGRVQLRRERIALRDVVDRAVETAQPLISRLRHILTLSIPSTPIWLYADAGRIEQVVINLLNNAAKYTLDGGNIWLNLSQENDMAVMKVGDTGVGIDEALLPDIFDLFTQADRSLDRSDGGLGIGLAIVRQLVELHDGTVKVNSVLGQGSEFIVRLPLMLTKVPLVAPVAAEGSSDSPLHKSCRVLVVDDNVDGAQMLTILLKAAGHDTWLAHDGSSALLTAIECMPDVILLDIGLPGLDGYAVASRIRSHPALMTVTLVAVTGYGQETDRMRARQAGFDHYLVKPAQFAEVEKILASVSAARSDR